MLKNIFHQGSHTLINITFAVVIVLTLAAISIVQYNNYSITHKAEEVNSKGIPSYDLLHNLGKQLLEQERFLYEFFVTERESDFKRGYIDNYTLSKNMVDELSIQFGEIRPLQKTAGYLEELNKVVNQFHVNILSEDTDWNLAEEQLHAISDISHSASGQVLLLGNIVDKEVSGSEQQILRSLEMVNLYVVLYGLVISLIAFFVFKATGTYLTNANNNKRLSLFPTRNPNPVISLDHKNKVTYANPASDSLLQRLDFPIGQTYLLLCKNIKAFQDKILAEPSLRSTFFEYQIKQLHFQCNLHWLEDQRQWDIHLVDITDRKRIEKELSYRASHEPETCLKNRYELERIISNLSREDEPFSLGLIEIRSFSQLLTGQGVAVASTVMKEVATVIREAICGLDMNDCCVYHIGEKSFALVSRDNSSKDEIHSLVRELEQKVSNTKFYSHYEVRLDFGFSCYPLHGNEYSTLHKSALAALDKSANSDDKSHIVFNPELGEKLRYQQQLIDDMREAISYAHFELYFQPQLEVESGRITGAEVLIRWQRKGEWVSPAEFIPLAEGAGLIEILGDWILYTACEKAKNFLDVGLTDIVIAVNISPLQFGRKDFLNTVEQVLKDTQLPPQNLELEITEGVIIYNEQETIETLEKLKKLGVQLAIDDFGTGYSSLSYLKKFNIDKLKIDQSFVRHIQHENADQSIVRTIIELGRNLGLKLIAEGVEEKTQLQILKSMGCDEIQGYYYSRPLPEHEFIKFAQHHKVIS